MPDLSPGPLGHAAPCALKLAVPSRDLVVERAGGPQIREVESLRPGLDFAGGARAGLTLADLIGIKDNGLGGEVAVVRVVEAVVDKVAREHLDPARGDRAVGHVLGRHKTVRRRVRVRRRVERVGHIIVAHLVPAVPRRGDRRSAREPPRARPRPKRERSSICHRGAELSVDVPFRLFPTRARFDKVLHGGRERGTVQCCNLRDGSARRRALVFRAPPPPPPTLSCSLSGTRSLPAARGGTLRPPQPQPASEVAAIPPPPHPQTRTPVAPP